MVDYVRKTGIRKSGGQFALNSHMKLPPNIKRHAADKMLGKVKDMSEENDKDILSIEENE